MKVNMKKNRLYAAMAAVVLLAAGCTDEIENTPVGPDTPEADGQKCYVTVNIATGTGAMTKANGGSDNGEGDVYLPEIKTLKEDLIKDVNIFLVSPATGDGTSKKYLGTLNQDIAADANIAIVGHGYQVLDPNQTPSGGTEPNHDQATVMMTLTKPLDATPITYQVFTVVNYGASLSSITSLDDLRDNLSDKAWSLETGSNVYNIDKYESFVMSTHQMVGQVYPASEVSLSTANSTESSAAETTVYVERLAARVDLKVADGLYPNATTPVTTEGARSDGSFTLNRYLVVNQWNEKTYMFKQVTPTVNSWSTSYTDAIKGTYTNDQYKYLGDEVWNLTEGSTTGVGTFNYVISPDITTKTTGQFSSLDSKYDNHFYMNGTTIPLDPTSTTIGWQNVASLKGSESYKTGEYTPIVYTKENTTCVDQQKNGYSTGLIFESTFTPNVDDFKLSKYSEGKIEEQKWATTDNIANTNFLTANHKNKEVVYADVKTIAAMAFEGVFPENPSDGVNYSDIFKGLMGDGWPTTAPNFDKVKECIEKMAESNKVEAAFKAYLRKTVNQESATFESVSGNLTYTKFLEESDQTDVLGGKNLVEPQGGATTDYIGTLYKNYGVSYYKGGKSYYKFWIRHDDNGADYRNVMGIMEFAIVRNNVYQLNVTGIRELGDPLPFTPGKDDPNNPDENKEVRIKVQIFVKNWVNRRNDDIIL